MPAAALVLLGYAVSDYAGSRGATAFDAARSTPKLPVEVAAKARSWNWSQSTGDSSRVEIFAESFSQDAAGGQIDLYGVELRVFHEEGSVYDRVVSDAATFSLTDKKLFSEGETVITLDVPAAGRAERRTVITTSAVTFYTAGNQARTERPTAYVFDGGRGRSVGAVYESGAGVLHMRSDVYLERFAAGPEAVPTRIRAGELYYHEQAGRIDLRQRAKVERGAQWLDCSEGTVWLYEGAVRRIEAIEAVGGERGEKRAIRFETPRFEAYYSANQVLERLHGYGETTFTAADALQTLTVNGARMTLFYRSIDGGQDSELERVDVRRAARVRSDPRGAGLRRTVVSEVLDLRMRPGGREVERIETHEPGRIELLPVGMAGGRKTLDAKRIGIAYGDANRMRSLSAAGGVRLLREPEKEGLPALETWSAGLEADFDPQSDEMTRLRQWDGFRFVEGERRGRADTGIFDAAANALELTGKAEVVDAAGRVTARRIMLNRAAQRLEAETEVTSVFYGEASDPSAGPGAGLFAEDAPVYAAAARMLSDQRSGVIEYRGQARLWQEANRVEAERITIDRGARTLSARRRVATSLTAAGGAGEKAPEPVTVYAADLRYDEDSRRAVFDGQVDFRRGRLRVLSDSLTAVLAAAEGEAGGMESAAAAGAVRISEMGAGTGRSGFGERAVYDPEASAVVLTGRPARLVSAAGDETRGAELTYLTDGDRLRVSSRGSDRAYTYRRARK